MLKIRERLFRFLVKCMIGIVVLVILGTVIFLGLQISGRSKLTRKAESNRPDLSVMRGTQEEEKNAEEEVVEETEEDSWQEGDIRYKGKIYRYNEDILTFLFLGIDQMSEVKEAKQSNLGGQSDAIFLMVLNSHKNEVSIIGINRDTMTDIDVYSKSGVHMGVTQGQICLQHAYGDGKELSCERSVQAVSNLFYNLPIHGYCSINMGAIPLLNDAVGGVELEALETIKFSGANFTEGQKVKLKGMEAYYYLHHRDTNSFNSAGRRLERQKQYLKVYSEAVKAATKKDITMPVKLYSSLSKYMVTDVTVDEVSYLATQIIDYNLDADRIYSLQGETVQGETFEEFYVDETALYELILEVFYEEVN